MEYQQNEQPEIENVESVAPLEVTKDENKEQIEGTIKI